MQKFVLYRRLSRDSKSGSNLGLDAQQYSIDNFLKHKPGHTVLAKFTEIESGTRKGNNRPELRKALEMCKERQAVLVISTISRLSRNVHFISGLIESNVEFVAIDMPVFNKTMLYIAAAFAEQEADFISQRTKAALQELKRQGKQLGTAGKDNLEFPQTFEGVAYSRAKTKQKAVEFATKAFPYLSFFKQKGFTNVKIAEELNKLKYEAPGGKVGKWTSVGVARCFMRVN